MPSLYGYVAIAIVILGFITAFYVRGVQIQNYKNDIEELEVERELAKDVHKIQLFENNQSVILKMTKDIEDEVPSNNGSHTISF